ncbi:MAG: hypothetical protein OXT67_04920 [Zetaproteobacteria bacterium]|nr:hypothetical protein [Zetaproteobacteria bacterium]
MKHKFRYVLFALWVMGMRVCAQVPREWLQALKQAEAKGEAGEFLWHHPPPDGLVVIHAWDASPYLHEDKAVGHMALQVEDCYLSVWPEKSGVRGARRRACGFALQSDLQDIQGPASLLVLQLPFATYDLLKEEMRAVFAGLQAGKQRFSIGKQQFIFPAALTLVQSGGDLSSEAEWSQMLLERAKHNFLAYLEQRVCAAAQIGSGTGAIVGAGVGIAAACTATAEGVSLGAAWGTLFCPGAGTAAGVIGGAMMGLCVAFVGSALGAGVGAGIGSLGLASDTCSYVYPEHPEAFLILHSYPRSRHTTNCTKSILNCLKVVPQLALIIEQHILAVDQQEQVFLQAHGRYSVGELYRHRQDPQKCFEVLTRELAIYPMDEESRDKMALIAACVSVREQVVASQAEAGCQLLVDGIQRIAFATNFNQALQDFQRDLEINLGRMNLIFADPSQLPGGVLRLLAWRLFEQGREIYLYSSLERDFGSPVGNQVRIRNVYSGKYMCPLGGICSSGNRIVQSHRVSGLSQLFWLVPAGIGQRFALLSAVNKKAVGVAVEGESCGAALSVLDTDFGEHQCFYFAPEGHGGGPHRLKIFSVVAGKPLYVEGGPQQQHSHNARIHLRERHAGESQQWTLENVK